MGQQEKIKDREMNWTEHRTANTVLECMLSGMISNDSSFVAFELGFETIPYSKRFSFNIIFFSFKTDFQKG